MIYFVLGDNPICKAYTDLSFKVIKFPLKIAKKIQIASKTRDEMLGTDKK